MTKEQEFYLKKMAALQFPGSADNLCTGHPLHMVQTQTKREVWHGLNDAGSADDLDSCVFFCSRSQETYPTPEALVAEELGVTNVNYKEDNEEWKKQVDAYNEGLEDEEFLLVPFENERSYTDIPRKNSAETETAFSLEDYFDVYAQAHPESLDVADISVIEEFPEYESVGPFFINDEAKEYKKYQGHNLTNPRTYAYGEAYGSHGDYAALYDFLRESGSELLKKETEELFSYDTNKESTMHDDFVSYGCDLWADGAAFDLPVLNDASGDEKCYKVSFALSAHRKWEKPDGARVTVRLPEGTSDAGDIVFHGETDNFTYSEAKQFVSMAGSSNEMDGDLAMRCINDIRYRMLKKPVR